MKHYKLLILLLITGMVHGQGVGLWTGATVEKKLNSRFSISASGQTRFSDNVSVLQSYLGEAGLEYKFTKYLEASVNYRYFGKRKLNDSDTDYYYRSYHRFYGNVKFDHKITDWLKFDYRFRYQHQFKDDESGLTTTGSYFRHKFEFSYKNKSSFSPYVSADVFYLIGTGFDQVRYKTGVDISLTKRNSIDLSVFQDRAIGGTGESDPLVFNIGYKLKLKENKSKKH
ncbi:uncharacterized protein DUF2490 [Dyadobacter jejuensis]|uniref:Uncharacterized protein DUF2490 n=1 Tax=Dyadobacter jejuensis TaxID=1082580 RepID=A0A316AKW4_9BACT|nr:DUF2490 domain-containing protein [Dyadobacter jejuensis]PWJ57889.1 uncharacterized protein DUF2490 [Dyadobacter jejuensis]